jgi:3-dehydroquinate dehydratase-1
MDQINELNQIKPELVELRYDLLGVWPEEINHKLLKDIRQVATCRPGMLSEQERQKLILQAIELGVDYVDLEIESPPELIEVVSAACRDKKCNFILSYHNFEETPDMKDLKSLLNQAFKKGADVAKIACMVHEPEDNARLLSLYAEPGRKIILGMGKQGKITRLSALNMGGEFTFASLSKDTATAPGQLTYKELKSFISYIERL